MFDFKGYKDASSIEEAVKILKDAPEAEVIAGGSDLLIELRDEPRADLLLVSLRKIEAVHQITMDEGGEIAIGSMVTFDRMEKDEFIMTHLPVLGEAGGTIGGPQLRRVATLGGNVCNGAVSGDSATPLFCYNARLEIAGPEGYRTIPVSEFYLGPGKTDLKKGEILVRILIAKKDYEGFGGNYIKFSRRKALDIANLGATALCKVKDGRFSEVRIALGVAAPVPIRCPGAENFAEGLEVTDDNMKAIGQRAVDDARPRDSWRASKAFRQQLIEVCTERALKAGADLAGK
ncbi:MAG: xanthine dehydrogenase FAD-binding subunit XdhB [Spirochaetales bacterium]|nr:xanthine dehydrogenase FAD-binding subunit XdhB [Spirochaetales bacterium]